jgi:signal peptidase
VSKVPRTLRLAATIALLIGWAVLLRPMNLGGPVSYLVIRGDSMLPAYETGDLVIVRAATSYAVGDVVAYRVPEGELGAGRLVLHRIVGGDGTAGFVMQGDNNPAPDPWTPRSGDVAGRDWARVPGIGRLIAFVHQPAAAGAIAVAVLVAVFVLRAKAPAAPKPAPLSGRRAPRPAAPSPPSPAPAGRTG